MSDSIQFKLKQRHRMLLAGSVVNSRVVNSLAHPFLVEAAIEAVKQWLYKPNLLNGEPIEVVTTIAVNFRLAQTQ
jgi:periplasmic protein TonB